MKCKLCESNHVKIEYKGIIRDGGLGKYTHNEVTMWKCIDCGVIWHDSFRNEEKYYESTEYRLSLDDAIEAEDFYTKYDGESAAKFKYTGTAVFRNRLVADIGCGCGAFLNYISGVAGGCIAIEPSEKYRNVMNGKGVATFPYTSDAIKEYKAKVDVVISFDVIEHVENPRKFLNEAYQLLVPGGVAIIGTPTDAPIMRELLGECYDRQLLFSTQHLWIFSEKSMLKMARDAYFKEARVEYFQRYGIGNILGWMKSREPKSEVNSDWITETMDAVWRLELCRNKMSDYMIMYCTVGGKG